MGFSWNTLEIGPPPNRSILTPNHGITDLKRICSNFQKILENQNALHVEAALLSRMIYRMKSKLRLDKGFQAMEKVNRCLLHYLKLNLASIYSNFTSCIRISIDGHKTNGMYAPTKQMLEHLLLRTQGFTKLICRIVQLCEVGAKYFMNRVDIGHSWNLALVSISIIARIWSLSKYLVLAACEHYNKLIPYLERLKYVGVQWTNDDIDFPKNLNEWLNVEWLGKKLSNNGNRKENPGNEASVLNKIFSHVNDVNDDVNAEEAKENLNIIQFKAEESGPDLGESVSRASIQKQVISNVSQMSTVKKMNKDKKSCKRKSAFECIKSGKDFLKFVKREEELRISQRNAAITRNLDNFQFHLLTKKIHKIVNKLNEIDQQKNASEFDVALKKSVRVLKLYVDQ